MAAPEPDFLAPLPFSDLSDATHKNYSLGGTKQHGTVGLVDLLTPRASMGTTKGRGHKYFGRGLERPLQAEIWEPSVPLQALEQSNRNRMNLLSVSPEYDWFCSYSSLSCPSFPNSSGSFSPPSASQPGSGFQDPSIL